MSPLVRQVQEKQRKLAQLLEQVWALEAELNAVHQLMSVPAKPRPKHRLRVRTTQRTPRPVVLAAHTDRRVRHALLSGPLAHAHESFPLSMLVDRCEDIAGVNEGVVAHVLDGLIAAGMVAKVGALYQRAA